MSKRKPIKIDLPIIQKIYETQQKIFQEDSRHVVESFCRKNQLTQITEKANESFKKEKEHFEITRNLIAKSLRKKTNKDQSCTLINTSSIQNKTLKMPGLFDITISILNTTNSLSKTFKDKEKDTQQDLIDLLTFSLIPSYLNFFWVDSSIKKFVKYFTILGQNTISIDHYNQLARSVFVTPSFLLYLFYAFQPIFSKIFNCGDRNISNFIKDNFSQSNFPNSISKYNNMIPREVFVALICSSQPSSTFLNSFLNIALSSPETMHIYNLLHFSQVPSKEFLKAVRTNIASDTNLINLIISAMTKDNIYYAQLHDYFNTIINNVKLDKKYANNLISEVNDTSRFKIEDDDDDEEYDDTLNTNQKQNEASFLGKHLFNDSDQKYCPEIFQPFLLSSNDLSLFDFYFKKTPTYVFPDRLEYFRVYSDNEVTRDNLFNAPEATMAHGNAPTPFLRHLLQLSDPLPKFKEKPSNVSTIDDFVNIYLVERGDIRTYAQRKYNAESFLFFRNMFPQQISEILRRVSFSRVNDIMALSAFANIDKKLQYLDGNSQESRSIINLISDSQKKDISSFRDPHSDTDYFKMPKLFSEDFNLMTSRFNGIISSKENLNKIVYSKLLSNQKIDFQTFMDYRTSKLKGKQNLRKLDQEFSTILLSSSFIEKYIIESIEMKHKIHDPIFDKGIYLKRFIDTFEPNYFNKGYEKKSNDYEAVVNEINLVGEGTYKSNDYFECKYIGDMIIEAFQEKSLMRKIDILSHCFTKIKNELNKNFPPEKSPLAEPEFEPTICSIFMKINPPSFYSNYVFLHDMIGSLSPEDIFVGSSRSIFHYMKLIVNRVFDEDENKINSCMLFNEYEDM